MSADPNDELPTDGESLDALLREARWPSATQPAVARLTQHWEKVWVARRRREMLMRRAAGLALAAGLLGAVTIGLYRIRPQEKPVAQIKQPPGQSADRRASAGERGSVTKNPQPIEAAGHETRRPTSPDPTAVVDGTNKKAPSADLLADLASSRPPNELEQLMLDAAERTRKRTRAITKAAKQPENQRGIAHTIAKSSKDRRKASAASQTKRSEALMVATAVKRLVSDSSADIVKLAADVRARDTRARWAPGANRCAASPGGNRKPDSRRACAAGCGDSRTASRRGRHVGTTCRLIGDQRSGTQRAEY
jgi:hypothetical protein